MKKKISHNGITSRNVEVIEARLGRDLDGAVEFCEILSRRYGVELTLGQASEIMEDA